MMNQIFDVSEEVPKYHETFIPILDVLADGEPLPYNELRMRVRDKHFSHLSADALSLKTKTGDVLILNRIGWAKSDLKAGRFLHQPQRGVVQIKEKGKKALSRGELTLEQLKADPDYIAWQQGKPRNKPKSPAELRLLLEASPEDLIDLGITQIEVETKDDLLRRLKELDPYYFEKVILILLKKMGYGEFTETKKSNDGGIDGVMNQDHLGLDKIYMQAKRYVDSKIRETDIRNFIGAMSGDTNKGVFVTTSSFDEAARVKASQASHKIILIDGEQLTELMHRFGVGVQTKAVYEVKQLDEDFFDNG